MWLLKDSNGKIKYLKLGEKINVGRRQPGIVLENDSSISRAHSVIEVKLKKEATLAERITTCTVKDANSKYGTHIIRNGIKIKVSTDGVELQPSDTLQFGLQQHIYKVEYNPIITVISRITDEHKAQLKGIAKKIGFHVTDKFDSNCTHLTATTATCTTKVISALIAGIPVINIKFWEALALALEKNEKLPDPNDYVLPLIDKGINTQRVSLKPNPVRKRLFEGKKFIFFSEKECKEYNQMIKDAGGEVELYSGSLQHIPEDFFADNSVIMQITDDSLTNDMVAFNTFVYDRLHEKKLRMISETEIPLAIVYVCLDQYCNPKYHFKELIKRKSMKKDESKILALDTQDIAMTDSNNEFDKKTKQVCLPETNDFIEEDIPKEEANSLNIVSPQFDIENNSEKEVTVQRTTDKTFSNKIVNTGTNLTGKRKEPELMQTSESNFRLKRSSNNTLESFITKKRAKESSDDEMSKNVQSGWKSKKKSNSLEITKKQSTLTKSKNDFDELEQRKSEITENKQDKLSKWGFKKITKKSIDFDLDDFEEEDTLEEKQKSDKPVCDTNRELENSVKKVTNSESQRPFKVSESYKNNSISKENMDKNWTAFKAAKSKNDKSNLVDNQTCRSNLVRPHVKMEEANNEIRTGSKTFKKVCTVIPVKRIALADMKVWRPNS